jgi:membrane-associated phospholipid phosphatase
MALGFSDTAILHAVQNFHPISIEYMDYLIRILTELGSPLLWFFLVAFLYWKGQEKASFHLMNLIVFSVLVVGAAKEFFHKPRPSVEEGFRVLVHERFGGFSFPSGHSTTMAAIFGYYLNNKNKVIVFGLGITTIIVAFSRLYLGAHFPSDVVVGVVLGTLIGMSNNKVVKNIEDYALKLSKLQDEIIIGLMLIGAVTLFFLAPKLVYVGLFFGYYGGLYFFKKIGFKQKKISKKDVLTKTIIGFMGMALLTLPIVLKPYSLADSIQFGLMLLLGLWVSVIVPVLYEKALNPSKQ